MIIVTNNSMVVEALKLARDKEIVFIDGNYGSVLLKIRDLVHSNHKLLTHPLSGSIKPNETPYKSIAIMKSESLDFNSLDLIENAIATYEKMQSVKLTPNWTERVLDDFRTIDCDLFLNAIKDVRFPS